MGKRWSFGDFLYKARENHGDKYDYSLVESDFINANSVVKIICPIHGEIRQCARTHITSCGCGKCAYDTRSNKIRKSKDVFVDDAHDKFNNKYDYSLVEYKTSKDKVKIVCPIHGVFEKSPSHHLRGQGCPKCSVNIFKVINEQRHNDIKKNFVNRARKVHIDDYEYLSEYVNHSVKILIKCNTCGVEFRQKPHNHLSGQGCPSCKSSKGEKAVGRWLIDNNVNYVKEKWFDDCRGVKRPLPFDFWLPDNNILIEFQGRQHYELVKFSQREISKNEMIENFEATKRNDEIKKQYCLDNNIELIEIPYWDLKRIDNILEKKLK